MANYIIIGSDGKEYGPIGEDQLRQWLTDGRLNARSRMKTAGATEWKVLSDFPEFQDVAKTSTPPPLPAAGPTFTPKTSHLAITSLVLGILGLFTCGFTALFGLILGIVALAKVKNSGGKLNGHGLALAGTIVSGLFLLMIPIFAALLLPALAGAKGKAQQINCSNNERQLSLAVKLFSGDNTNHFPPAATWCDAIKTYAGSEKVFKCVSANSERRCDYAYNAKLDGLDESQVNPRTVVFFEADGGWNANGGRELMLSQPRHGRMFVVAFADGSVQFTQEAQLNTLRWDP